MVEQYETERKVVSRNESPIHLSVQLPSIFHSTFSLVLAAANSRQQNLSTLYVSLNFQRTGSLCHRQTSSVSDHKIQSLLSPNSTISLLETTETMAGFRDMESSQEA
jgi:hypothetical protein